MQVGQQVSGEYLGTKFSGVITEARAITVKTDGAFEFHVALPAPMTVFGHTRDHLIVCAKFDGSPSSYTRHQQWLA